MRNVLNVPLILLLIFASCTNKQRVMNIDKDTQAEGNITNDTMYEGLIKFYNRHSGKLISTSTYSNGKLNGENIEYNESGSIISKVFYNDGLQNGLATIYDEKGKKINEYFSFFGLKAGDDILYANDKPSVYNFYSFDSKKLMSIYYDSIGVKSIPDIQQGFFFYTKRTFLVRKNSSEVKQAELFLYTPNPPNYEFRYSLVLIDEKYNIKSELKKFSISDRWAVVDLDFAISTNDKLAIKLEIQDPNIAKQIVMFKVIE